ncbi:hypothetical protein [Bradyrhizobium sp. JR3.5]
MNFRISLAQRIYAIVGLSFCGLTGLAAIQAVSIECALPDAATGEPVELEIDGLSFRLGGVVARMDPGSVLINLNQSPETAQKLAAVLSGGRARSAAA